MNKMYRVTNTNPSDPFYGKSGYAQQVTADNIVSYFVTQTLISMLFGNSGLTPVFGVSDMPNASNVNNAGQSMTVPLIGDWLIVTDDGCVATFNAGAVTGTNSRENPQIIGGSWTIATGP